ncbi:hypothetical protein [Streptomyces sp. CA-111067]|uniref:hypothetical protein n=1 Tax=Streptomyces sp. CA-111067 TaxID=3240046 RepID=UPI003D96718A
MVRLGGLLTAVTAAVGLVLLPPSAGGGQAHAADAGSAVTKSGTKGTYDDFSHLKVTVEQTKNLRTQGLKVTWTGGAQSAVASGAFLGNYLQIMQCWGNAANGPTPEQCEFGNPSPNSGVQNASRDVVSSDPGEPTTHEIPFTTVKGDSSTDVNQFFTPFATNEQDLATTDDKGDGETIFQAEAANDSGILGCGSVTKTGQALEPCWLVVVPRGLHEPDGSDPGTLGLNSSPLSAGNWNQRIVFRLDFDPTESVCPIGQDEQPTIGSALVGEAMYAWTPTLCTTGQKINFGYLPQSEDVSRGEITGPNTGTAGIAFVENPIQPQPDVAPVVHAPMAVSGLVIGYNVQVEGSSRQIPQIRLNARLVAKMLTESYKCEIPHVPNTVNYGNLSAKNAESLQRDPEFKKLNPDVPYYLGGSCGDEFGLVVPQDGSDSASQLWQWLRSDPDAKNFLAGKPDPWGAVINRYFLDLDPAHTTPPAFPKPDPTVWTPDPQAPDLQITAPAINPLGNTLSDNARTVRKANNGGVVSVDATLSPPAFVKASPQRTGQHFIMGLTDAASAARYRLGTAELLNADGQFVAPTVDALTKAVNGMKPSKVPGVLDANPALKTPGAYPLTTVSYAAASTTLSATQRKTYATLIRYAAGAGQKQGIGFGLLPPGYAPLTPSQRVQALDAASALIAGQVPTTPPDDSAGGGSNSGGTGSAGGGPGAGGTGGTGIDGSGGASGGGSGTATGGSSTGGSPSASPSSSAAAAGGTSKGSSGGPGAAPPVSNVAQTGGKTPGAILGAVRWVLLIVLIAGIFGSLAGPLLMRVGTIRGTGRALIPFRGNKPA